MNVHCFIVLSLIFPLPCISALELESSCSYQRNTLVDLEREVHVWQAYSNVVEDMKPQIQVSSIHDDESPPDTEVTKNLRTWKGQNPSHQLPNLRNAHGILNIMGYGTLLPIGAITARYFRKVPFKCSEWYSVHVRCQSAAYMVGTTGWCIGMLLGHSSKQRSNKTHRVLGIIIFTFTTIQMLANFWQPRKEDKCAKYWKIYHHLLGYAIIALTIANTFEGINNLGRQAANWKWGYVGVLGVLVITAVGLEIFRWIKSRRMMHEAAELNSNMYMSP